MEAPFKVELPRLTHLGFLQLLLPFIPGVVIILGFAVSNSWVSQRFATLPIGYKTKVTFAIVVTYVIGLILSYVTQAATSIVIGLIKPATETLPWNNAYWRQVAGSYVGVTLSPEQRSYSSRDLDAFVQSGRIHTSQQVLETSERKLRELIVDSNWRTLHLALRRLPTELQDPFGAFYLIAASMQAAALGELYVVLEFGELRYSCSCHHDLHCVVGT